MSEHKHTVRPGRPMGGGPRGMMPGEKAKNFKGTIGKLLKYLGRFKIAIACSLVFAAASTVFMVVGPKISGQATT